MPIQFDLELELIVSEWVPIYSNRDWLRAGLES